MSSSNRTEKLQWGEWVWSEQDQAWVRSAFDNQGNFVRNDYRAADIGQHDVPRGADDVGVLAADVGALATDFDNVYISSHESYPESTSYTHHTSQHATGGGSHGYSQGASNKSSSKSKAKEVQKDGKPKSTGSGSKTQSYSAKGKPTKKSSSHTYDKSTQDAIYSDPFYSSEHSQKDDVPQSGIISSYSSGPDPKDNTQPIDPGYGARQAGKGKWQESEVTYQQTQAPAFDEVEPYANDPSNTDPSYYVDDTAYGHHKSSKSRKGKAVAHGKGHQGRPVVIPDRHAEEAEDANFQAAITESRSLYQSGGRRHGEASSRAPERAYEEVADYYPEEQTGEITPRATSPVRKSSAYSYDSVSGKLPLSDYNYDEERPIAVHAGIDHIQGDFSTGYVEELDPRFVIQPSGRFQPGEVFKVLWSEPHGNGKTDSKMTDNEIKTIFGEKFYVCFRRFVVVANDEGHCTCVPILTYERRGCTKKGVKPLKHGIVHAIGTKPRLMEGEPKLGFKPVRLEMMIQGEKLASQSRINYSKLVTVEHNVKVFFIGHILAQDFDNIVSPAVDQCWDEKIREQKRRPK